MGRPPDVQFVRAVVIVEADDRTIRTGFAVVKRVLESVGILVRHRHGQHADSRERAVVVRRLLVADDRDVTAHLVC